jgi:hypothetical protein
MRFSRALRRFAAIVVAILYLACQGMAVTYASSPVAAQPGTAAAPGSCHDSGQQPDAATGKCPTQCLSQHNTFAQSGVSVFATTDLPAITISTGRIVAVADSAPPSEDPLLRAEPPPLRILNCCLRN